MGKAAQYQPTKREAGQILREAKQAALKGDTAALLAFSNLQLADAILQRSGTTAPNSGLGNFQ